MMIDFELSGAQLLAADDVLQVFNEKTVCLLQGVTASGKTQIYIKLIEQYIKLGKQVLYMLPEIALTAQIIRRLQKHGLKRLKRLNGLLYGLKRLND